MTHVHYKFSSKLSYDTVLFDGPHITLRDLKRQIMGREKLRAADCDLQITNAQTKEEYTDDEGRIPKGSSVIVRRIPIIGVKSSSSSKKHNIERSDNQHHHAFGAIKAMDDHNSSRALPLFSKMANLAHADLSEDDKIKAMMNQSTYDSMSYTKKFGGVLPVNYTCYRCGNTGHHIRNCPTSGQDKNFEAPLRIKKSTGIPRSFMVEVDDPSIKGAMLTNCGRYAIPTIDAEAYAIGKKEKPTFVPQEQPESEADDDPVPDELLCLICHDLLSDAVVIPCCGNSYCDDCIRTALLDSEEHVCPTCSQSDVSPDTLIANKFLRQAVNNYKKERGHTKNLRGMSGTSQSLNPTPTSSPVPTPPALTTQSQSQKPHQSTHSQQDALLPRPQPADTPPLSQVSEAPPAPTGPTSASSIPSTSLQPVQSHLEIPDKEAEGKTHDDSAPVAPLSVLVSNKVPSAAPSQLIPLVTHTPVVDQPPSVSVNPQPCSSGPAPRLSGPSTCWDSSSSSSGCPTRGWTESNTVQLPPPSSSSSTSTSYSATPPPPLFPSPHFHTFLSAQQPLSGFPPGYPPTTPIWTLPNPQGAPIPSLCSSTSSIPALIPKEWFRHQRKKKERSPHRGSSNRRSSSRSNSKPSKSKSSRSYSRSSSRSSSRSRSRSQGKSRPRSPYSRARDLHTRSHPSRSYSYGYKQSRSPTPSSSSSPRVGHHSRSKSPSDHRKNRQHSKKSASSSYSSRRGGERSSISGLSQREAGGSWGSLDTHLYDQHANQNSSLDLDRERYLQWKREYKERCEKYFNSYVSHFHQLPPSLLTLPPPPPNPQWGEKEGSRNHSQGNLDSRYRPQGRRSAQTDGRSPPSQSSSDSRSPPSQSSSDSRSPPSQSSSDSRSPASQPSSDTCSTPSEERAHQPRCTEKDGRLPIMPREGSKEVEVQERSKNKKLLIATDLDDLSTLKHAQKSMRKHEGGGIEESSSPDAADSTDDSRNNKRRPNTRPNACNDFNPAQDEAAASDAIESVQHPLKPDQPSDKNYERKSREQRHLEREKGWRRGKDSDSRQDLKRHHKGKPSEEAGRDKNPGGSKASDSRSEKKRKRKGEGMERERSVSVKTQSSKCLKTKVTGDPESRKSESPKRFGREMPQKEKKKEKKTWPLKETDIWEGEIKVKPQKKISININLDGKRKEEKNEKQDFLYLEKSKEGVEKTATGEEEKLNRGETEVIVNERKESAREQEGVLENKIKPDEKEARQMWEKATFRDDKQEMWETIAGEGEDVGEKKGDGEEEDFNVQHCSLRGVGRGDRTEASKREEVTRDERSVRGKEEEEERVRSRGQEMREFVAGTQTPPGAYKPKEALMEGESKSRRSRNETHRYRAVEDGSSTSTMGSWRTVVKPLEEYTQDRAEDREDKLLLIQVPLSKWEKEESEEEEQDEGEIKVQTGTLPVARPPPLVTQTNKETEGENEQKRQRSVEAQRERERAAERGRDREKERNSSDRSVAPSSGKDRSDSSLCTDRDRDRGRERERQERKSQKENERAKVRTREEERGRDKERERDHSSIQKRNPSSSSYYSFSSTSRDTERRDISSVDQNAHKTHRDILLDLISKGKDEEQKGLLDYYHHNHKDPTQNSRRQDTPAGTHHSPSSLSHSWGKERDPLPSKSPRGPKGESEPSKPRMSSPEPELMHVGGSDEPNTWRFRSQHAASPTEPPESSQDMTSSSEREKEKRENKRRNESREEKGEWKRYKLDKVIKESKAERETRGTETERERGSRWETDRWDEEAKWWAGRELEEGERPSCSSSVSSSASQGNSKDDRRKDRKKKQKKHKKEKRQAGPELEEGELKKHKKSSKKYKEGSKEESSGEMDDRWKEEEDHAKLPFSVQKVPGFHF